MPYPQNCSILPVRDVTFVTSRNVFNRHGAKFFTGTRGANNRERHACE